MEPEKLYMTVNPNDEKAKEIWLSLGFPEDHIIPLEENDRLALVRSNLISLCEKCHQKVHKLYDISTEKYSAQKMLRSLIG